jgi:hypothetical protein
MSGWKRWAAAALFCATFGFAGGLAGIWLMADHIRGEQGAQGARGETGPPGPPGPEGPAADTARLQSNVADLDSRLGDLEDRVPFGSGPLDEFCIRGSETQVVTDVQVIGAFDPTLDVRRAFITPCE